MATFQTKSDLPIKTQQEIDRIEAIASGQRNSVDSNFLTALSDYLYNTVDLRDEDSNIVIASGRTVPTGLSGFAKSAMFRKTDVATGSKGLYENVGDVNSAVWDLIGQVSGEESQLTDAEAPVNAVNSYAIVTASSVVAGLRAESVVTANTVVDGDTLTIGAITYRAKTTPAQAYDVALGANDAEFLDNLKLAINASGVGDGTDYFAGTLAHPVVVATTNGASTQKVVARASGTSANATATTSTGGTLTWADTTLGGGTGDSNAGVAGATAVVDDVTYTFVNELAESIAENDAIVNEVLVGISDATALDNFKSAVNGTAGEGTVYSTGTAQPTATVTATTNTDTTQTIEFNTAGVIGDGECAVSATGGLTFDDTNLHDGVDGTVGDKGQQYVGSTYLYTAIDDNTISGKNWRRVSLGSVY